MAGGRPTKYDASICDTLPELFSEGASIAEVCVKLGIHKDTFYAWKEKYPEFSDSIKHGLSLAEAWWSRIGVEGTLGSRPINPTMWIFNMKNRFAWTDRREVSMDEDTREAVSNVTVKIVMAEGSAVDQDESE